jgi:hypothetical protein
VRAAAQDAHKVTSKRFASCVDGCHGAAVPVASARDGAVSAARKHQAVVEPVSDDAIALLLQVYEAQHAVHRVALSHLDNDAVKALVDGVCQRWHQFAQPGQLCCSEWS